LARALAAILIAAAGALLLAVPEIAGVATWKWVLGAIGLVLFVASGRPKRGHEEHRS
jgi:hypothetical protein